MPSHNKKPLLKLQKKAATRSRRRILKVDKSDPIDRWRGKGRLPIGNSVDQYLKIIRGS